MAVGYVLERGEWSGGVVASLTPTTGWAALANAGVASSEQENTNSAFTWDPATATLTLPDDNLPDGFLIVGAIWWRGTHNNRSGGPVLRWDQATGSGNYARTPTSGYARNNNNDEAFVRCLSFIDAPTAGGTFTLDWKRDTGAGTVAGGLQMSAVEIIPFCYNAIGMYKSTAGDMPGGTTPAAIGGFTVVHESDTDSIELTGGNTFTIKRDNKRYMVIGSQYAEGMGGRTQRWHGFTVGGTWQTDCQAYSYIRNTTCDECGEFFMKAVQTQTADLALQSCSYRGDGIGNNQGGADISGITTGLSNAEHMMVILELDDSVELLQTATNSSQVIGGLNVDLNIGDDIKFNDAAAFEGQSATQIRSKKAGHIFMAGMVGAAYNTVSSGTRYTGASKFTVNGTPDDDTISGDYGRGNQGSQDTFGVGSSMASARTLAVDADIGIQQQDWGDNGPVTAQAGWSSMLLINLDTMVPAAGDPAIYQGAKGLAALTLGPTAFVDKYLGTT